MSVDKLTCPECKKVLRPAKPLPEGKAVKCPHCGARFTAGGAAAGAPAGKPAGAPKKKAAKPAPAAQKAAPKKAAPKKKDDDSEEHGGVYGFLDGGAAEEEPEDKPKINYAPDMSIKDLRGPAVAAVVRPSNMVIGVGVLSFLGWIALLVIILIPVIFPLPEDDDPNKPAKGVQQVERGLATVADTDDPPEDPGMPVDKPSFWSFFGLDLARLGALGIVYFLLILSPLFLGMIYCGIMTFGAVKMQNLESYGWGMASSIMALFPFYSLGLVSTVALLIQALFITVMGERFIPGLIVIMVALVIAGMAGGLWGLMTMLNQDVIKGYEYKPEYEGGEG
jgi:hypothetical protein